MAPARCTLLAVAAAALLAGLPSLAAAQEGAVAGAGGILRNSNRYSLNLPLRQRGVIELRSPLRFSHQSRLGEHAGGVGSRGSTTTAVPIVNSDKLAPVPTPQVSTPNTPLRVKVDVSLPSAPAVKTVVLLNTFEAGPAVGGAALMSAATGIASVTVAAPALPGGAYILTVEAQLLGLTGKPYAATLHAPAFMGQTGPPVFRLSKYLNGTYSIPASLYRLMSSGQAYINVRTAKYPSGELRGQLCFENCALAVATGWQQSPIVRSKAFAVSQVLLDQRTGALVVATAKSRGTFSSPVTGVELRFGSAGISTVHTPITCPIVGSAPREYESQLSAYGATAYAGDYTGPGGGKAWTGGVAYDAVDVDLYVCPAALSLSNVRQFRAGLFFLNIRTVLAPTGEVRGQLTVPARLNATAILAAWLEGQERNVTQTVLETRKEQFTTTVPVQVPVQVKVETPVTSTVRVPYKATVCTGGTGHNYEDSSSSSGGGGRTRVRSREDSSSSGGAYQAGGHAGTGSLRGGTCREVTRYRTEQRVERQEGYRTEMRTVAQEQVGVRDIQVPVQVTRTLRSRGRGWELAVPLRLNPGQFVTQLSVRALSGKVVATELREAPENAEAVSSVCADSGRVYAPLPPTGSFAWHVFSTGVNPSTPLGDAVGPVSPFPLEPEVPAEGEEAAPVIPSPYEDWSHSNVGEEEGHGDAPAHTDKDGQQRTEVKSVRTSTGRRGGGYRRRLDNHIQAPVSNTPPSGTSTSRPSSPSTDDSSHVKSSPLVATDKTPGVPFLQELLAGQVGSTVRTTSFPLADLCEAVAGGAPALGEVYGTLTPRAGPDAPVVRSPTPPEEGKAPVSSPVPKAGVVVKNPRPRDDSSSGRDDASVTDGSSSAHTVRITTPTYLEDSSSSSGGVASAPLSEETILAEAGSGVDDGAAGSLDIDGLVDPYAAMDMTGQGGEAEGVVAVDDAVYA